MDLRSYHIPTDIGETIKHLSREDKVTWYQPFIFSERVITGTGAAWNAGEKGYFCTPEDSNTTQAYFLREALVLGDWYSYLAGLFVEAFPDAKTFLDFGCSNGHFGFDLTQRGKSYTGIDQDRNKKSYELVSKITDIQFEYIGNTYSEETHRMPSFEDQRKFDFGIFSVILMHLTDPHYAFRYFTGKIEQGMFYSTLLAPGNSHHFWARITKFNRREPLPHIFELVPTEPLAETLMRVSSFNHIYKIPYREGKDPKNTKKWGCWIAAKSPISEAVVKKFNLQNVIDKTDKYADAPDDPTTLSVPRL